MNQDPSFMDQAIDYFEIIECVTLICYLLWKIVPKKETILNLSPFSTIIYIIFFACLNRIIQEILTIVSNSIDDNDLILNLDTWAALLSYVGSFFRISLFSLFFYLVSKLRFQEMDEYDKSVQVQHRRLFYFNKIAFFIIVTLNFSAYFEQQNTYSVNRNYYNLYKTLFSFIWSIANLIYFQQSNKNIQSKREKYIIYWIFYQITTSFVIYSTLPIRGLVFKNNLDRLKCENEEIWCGHKDTSYSIYFFVYIQFCSYIPMVSIFTYFDSYQTIQSIQD